MKKLIGSIFILIVTAIMISGCSKNPTKVLVKKDGKWHSVIFSTATVASVSVKDTTMGTAIFTEDGKMTYQEDGSTVIQNAAWSYNKDTKKMTITVTSGSSTFTTVYDVTESKANEEKWAATVNESGFTIVYDGTLTRIK